MRRNVIRFYRDAQGKVRWHVKSANGRIVADSSQGYTKLASAVAGAEVVIGGSITPSKSAHTTIVNRPDMRVEYDL